MKIIFFSSILAALFLSSCDTQPLTAASSLEEKAAALQLTTCDQSTSHEIDFVEACSLIYNFVNINRKFVRNYGIGSYISKASLIEEYKKFDSTKTTNGYLLIDCFDGNEALFALRESAICKKEYRVSYVIEDTAKYNITSLRLNVNTLFFNQNSVANYLKGQVISEKYLDTKFDKIDGSTIRMYNNDLVAERGGENYHTSHGFSFFNIQDFKKFTDSPIVRGIAIFRGIEYLEEKPYDRIILVAVGVDGKFILNEIPILERSWPPKRLIDGSPN